MSSISSASSSELEGSSSHKECASSSDFRLKPFVGEKMIGLGLKTSAGMLEFLVEEDQVMICPGGPDPWALLINWVTVTLLGRV